MEMSELHCKNCGAPLQESEIRLDLGVARCLHCGSVFALPPRPGSTGPGFQERGPVPMPARFTLYNLNPGVQISYSWKNTGAVILLGFAIFWNLVNLIMIVFSFGMALCVSGPFLLLGIPFLYWGVAGILNRTHIRVAQGQLLLWHEPVPWFGNRQLPAGEIAQFYSKEVISHSRNGAYARYEVHMVLRNGTRDRLISGLTEIEQALYIEQTLERALGIQDQAVPGEFPRGA